MSYLTAPGATKTEKTYRYFVELASTKLNYEGVPEKIQIIDVVVEKPLKEAVASLIAETEWLQGYTMVAHWAPEDCTEF